MPGYLTDPASYAAGIAISASGNISAPNVQDAIYELDSEKSPSASPTFTGTVVLPSTTSIGDVSSTEIGFVDGVTSGIQTQIDSKAPLASPTFTGTISASVANISSNLTVDSGTLKVNASNNMVSINNDALSAYNGTLSVSSHGGGGTQASIFLISPGQGSGHIGFAGSTSTMSIRNTYADGLIANGKGIDINSSGIITMPYQPAFLAYGSGANISGANIKITYFINVETNIGNNYNTSNQRFTAPVNGFYHFECSCWRPPSTTLGGVTLRKNGTQIQEQRDSNPSNSGNYTTLIVTTNVYMNTGDYIEVYTTPDGGELHISNRTYTNFSGYLIG